MRSPTEDLVARWINPLQTIASLQPNMPARRRIRNARITGRTRRRPCLPLPPRPRVPALRAATATAIALRGTARAPAAAGQHPHPSPNPTGYGQPRALSNGPPTKPIALFNAVSATEADGAQDQWPGLLPLHPIPQPTISGQPGPIFLSGLTTAHDTCIFLLFFLHFLKNNRKFISPNPYIYLWVLSLGGAVGI